MLFLLSRRCSIVCCCLKLSVGLRSILSQPFPKSGLSDNADENEKFFQSFVQDDRILAFAAHFCGEKREESCSMSEYCKRVLYRCLTEEKPDLIATYLAIFKMIAVPLNLFSSSTLANSRLLLDFWRFHNNTTLDSDLLVQLERYIETFFHDSLYLRLLKQYATTKKFPLGLSLKERLRFGGYLIFYDLPSCYLLHTEISALSGKAHSNPLLFLSQRNAELLDIALMKMAALFKQPSVGQEIPHTHP